MAAAVTRGAAAIAGGAKKAGTAVAAPVKKAGAAGASAVAQVDAVVPSGRKTTRRVLARPKRIVQRSTGSFSQAAWTLIVTLLALALLALVLRVATTRPAAITGAFNVVPETLRKFVNPFGDNPLAGTTKKGKS